MADASAPGYEAIHPASPGGRFGFFRSMRWNHDAGDDRNGAVSITSLPEPGTVIPSRTFRLGVAFALLSLSSLASPRSGDPPTPNERLKSTEVSADRKVTFRIYAPKADEVSVSGDFGAGGKLTKDDQGVWSITVGPLPADFYSYTFNVDGVRTVDPKNPMIKP